jgi:uncharacterized protein (TIGR02391 family)
MVANPDAWPRADALTRVYFKRATSIDFSRVAAGMPPTLGRADQGRVVLTARGASYFAEARPHLGRYVKVVRRAVDRYPTSDDEPTVTSDDLDELGIAREQHCIVERIIDGERWALARVGLADGKTVYRLHSGVALALARVSRLSTYLEAQANSYWPAGDSNTPVPWVPRRTDSPPPAPNPQLDIGWLHPAVRQACAELMRIEHYREAVDRALVVLQDEIRSLAGTNLDGNELMHYAFSPKQPRIAVGNARSTSGKNLRRGTHLLATGLIAAVRNPGAHGLVDYSPADALERLAIVSLLYRQLDEVKARRTETRRRRRPSSKRAEQ